MRLFDVCQIQNIQAPRRQPNQTLTPIRAQDSAVKKLKRNYCVRSNCRPAYSPFTRILVDFDGGKELLSRIVVDCRFSC